ncbi:MAG: hypothetical protein FWG15_02720 [Propionibacteriaceae bacterium]|nr:hypothetical protein [Propionibacteriaceae bacterium]
MRTNEDMLNEIENANNGEGPDPIRTYEGDAVEAIAQAVSDRNNLDGFIESMVAVAQRQGASWAKIGAALGISRQAAHERYSTHVKLAA